MNKNHQDKTESKLIATENKSQLLPFSPEDEKEAQKELDRLRKRLRENENGAVKVNRKRTGFEDKTFWDKLNLFGTLALPLIIALATIGFGLLQVHLADLQHQSDQRLAQQQHDTDQKLAQQQHQSDQQRALDQQEATTLQTYLDNIQDLLLNHNLLKSNPSDPLNPYNDVATLAQARTLTALQGLDPERKGRLIQFIYDARLIGFLDEKNKPQAPIILLYRGGYRADLSGVNLSDAYLSGANLSNVKLGNADLSKANLVGAKLSGADLNNADFFNADLSKANLVGADLSGADFFYADLSNADLSKANLTVAHLYSTNLTDAVLDAARLGGADLSEAVLKDASLYCAYLSSMEFGDATITQQQLDQVSTCKNAYIPIGLTCKGALHPSAHPQSDRLPC